MSVIIPFKAPAGSPTNWGASAARPAIDGYTLNIIDAIQRGLAAAGAPELNPRQVTTIVANVRRVFFQWYPGGALYKFEAPAHFSAEDRLVVEHAISAARGEALDLTLLNAVHERVQLEARLALRGIDAAAL